MSRSLLAARALPFAIFAALFAGAVAMAVRSPASGAEQPSAGKPEIVAATFASAWCASCKVLMPKLARVLPGFKGKPVAFVELDFTFGDSDALRAEAQANRIAGVYERNKGATGFTVLVDYDSGEIIDILTMNFSEDALRSAIARAIAIASLTDERTNAAPDHAAPASAAVE